MTRVELRRRAVLILVLCVTSYLAVQSYRDIERATANTEGYTLNAEAYGWTVRFAQWDSAFRQYQDYPFFGSGLGTFKVLYPQYRTLNDPTTAGNYVHNDYIQLLAEGGPLLLTFAIALLLFLLYLFFSRFKNLLFKSSSDPNKDLELLGLVVAMGTVFGHGLMNFTLYMLLNQILLGCLLARIAWLCGLSQVMLLNLPRKWLVQNAACLMAVYVLAMTYADAMSHDLVYQGGLLPLDRHDPADQLTVFELLSTIRSFRGDSSTNRFAMATFYRTSFDDQPLSNQSGRRSLAIATALEYQAGLALNPYANDIRGYFADFLLQNPWLAAIPEVKQNPELLLRDGLALTPIQIQAHVQLADYLELSGQNDEAYELLKGAYKYLPLRYNNYRYWQQELKSKLLVRARSRNDQTVLEKILASD